MPEKPETAGRDEGARTIVIQQVRGSNWAFRLLLFVLIVSLLFNLGLYARYGEYYGATSGPQEKYDSGDKDAPAKIAIIEISGVLFPPLTEQVLEAIEKAEKDDAVKGVVLAVDSPGGAVADSHMIYHKLRELSEKKQKPIAVAMKRMAASGGYYVAMGAGPDGRIFAEPTTATGSIGVLIQYMNVEGLSEKIGVKVGVLKTGELKDALSPFRQMTDKDREVWTAIMDDYFDRFLEVIADNRTKLDREQVEALATGQVYTAGQAKESGLIDEIGYQEDAVEHLKQQLGLEKARVVRYERQPALLDLLTGAAENRRPEAAWQVFLEATTPRALYLCSWMPEIGGLHLPR